MPARKALPKQWLAIAAISLISLLAVVGLAAIGAYLLLPANPSRTVLSKEASADGRVIAWLEVVDNGLGFGLGRSSWEICIQITGGSRDWGGGCGTSLAFSTDVEKAGKAPSVHWTGPRHLLIEFPHPDALVTARGQVDGVAIELRSR